MKSFFKVNVLCKLRRNSCTNRMRAVISVLAALMLLSFTACGKSQLPDDAAQPSPEAVQTESPTGTSVDDAADGETWKTEFEKSLLENYGVKPDHYEELDEGIYQVYVEIDGKIIPYVVVDSATGDYHG